MLSHAFKAATDDDASSMQFIDFFLIRKTFVLHSKKGKDKRVQRTFKSRSVAESQSSLQKFPFMLISYNTSCLCAEQVTLFGLAKKKSFLPQQQK